MARRISQPINCSLYDAGGNVSTILDSLAGPQTQTFGYDTLDRLTSAYTTGGSAGTYNETYGYDSATGNLASKGNTTNTLTYLANANSCRVFDANGNITTGSHSIAHAVSAFGSNIYSYDCNGNQTTRTVNGQTFNLSYDAENRLVSVSGAATATFTYDGDGRQVKAVVGITTTYYVGAHYQVANGVITKYYFAGAQRVAMRKGSTLSFLLGDHLGSTSLTTNTSGALVSELRYKPWGETRYSSGTTPTNYQFTGQRNEVSIGLYFYNTRWYDSSTGRFAQADTIVPGGVQGLDRYAYANNSPVRYVDPSGHDPVCGSANSDPECSAPDNWSPGLASFGVSISSGWTSKDEKSILEGVSTVANALLNAYLMTSNCFWDGCDGVSTTSLFKLIFGNLLISKGNNSLGSSVCQASASGVACGSSPNMTGRFIAHELGHVFDTKVAGLATKSMGNASIYSISGSWVTGLHTKDGEYKWDRGLLGYPSSDGYYGVPDLYHGPRNWSDWNSNTNSEGWTGTAITEEWGDMFLNWSYGTFDDTYFGQARNNWMTLTISQLLP